VFLLYSLEEIEIWEACWRREPSSGAKETSSALEEC